MGVTVATTRVAANTSTGTQDITTTDLGGLTPKAALIIICGATADGTARDDAVLGWGAVTGASNRWALSMTAEHGQTTTDTYHGQVNDVCVLAYNATDGSLDGEADFSAWITNGIRINWTNALTNAYFLTVIFFAGTDLSAYAGNVATASTVDTETDVTAPGFEPDLLVCGMGWRDVGLEGTIDTRLSFGVCSNDGGGAETQRCLAVQYRDGRTTGEPYVTHSNLYAGIQVNVNGTLRLGIQIDGFDASGFSAWTRINSPGGDLFYLALSFGGVVGHWVGDYTTPTSTGNDAETGPGFTPQAVLLGMSFVESVNSVASGAIGGPFGLAVFDADEAYSNSTAEQSGVSTTNEQSLSDDTAVQLPDHDGSAGLTASFVSFDANGWTLNYSAVEANAKYFWALAIEEEAVGGDPEGSLIEGKLIRGGLLTGGVLVR